MKELKLKLIAAAYHLFGSAILAAISAVLVFAVFYPSPYSALAGGIGLWKLIVMVELSLGPLMSLVIYNSQKTFRHLAMDYAIVAMIQIAALAYGVFTLYQARPLALVFVKDRFELVTASDFSSRGMPAPQNLKQLVKIPGIIGAQTPDDVDSKNDVLMSAVLEGRDLHLFPEYYVAFDVNTANDKAQNLEQICVLPERRQFAKVCERPEDYLWMPVANNGVFWTGIFEKDSWEFVQAVPLDPWSIGDISQ